MFVATLASSPKSLCCIGSAALQGYITTDVNAYVGSKPPAVISYMEDASGQNLVLNVSVAFPGDQPRTSQVSATTSKHVQEQIMM